MTRLLISVLLLSPSLFAFQDKTFNRSDLIKAPKYLQGAVFKMDKVHTNVTIDVNAPTGKVSFPAHSWKDQLSTTRMTRLKDGEPAAAERFYHTALTFTWSGTKWKAPFHGKRLTFEKADGKWTWKAFDPDGKEVKLELEPQDEADLLAEIQFWATNYTLYSKGLPESGIAVGVKNNIEKSLLADTLSGLFGSEYASLAMGESSGWLALNDAAQDKVRFDNRLELNGQLEMKGTKLDMMLNVDGYDEFTADRFLVTKSLNSGGFRFRSADGSPVSGGGTIESEAYQNFTDWDKALAAKPMSSKEVDALYDKLGLENQVKTIVARLEETRNRMKTQMPEDQLELFMAKINEALAVGSMRRSTKDYLAVGLDADRLKRLEKLMAKPFMKQWIELETKRALIDSDEEFVKFAGSLNTTDPNLSARFAKIGQLMQSTGDLTRLEMILPGSLTVSFKALGQVTKNEALLNALNQYVVQTYTQQWDNLFGMVVISTHYLLKDMSDKELDGLIKAIDENPDASLYVETHTKALYAALADAAAVLDAK